MFYFCIIALLLLWPGLRTFDRVSCYVRHRGFARKVIYKVKFKGWFLFCPCYFPEDTLRVEGLTPLPRWHLWPLLDMAVDCRNFGLIAGEFLGWVDDPHFSALIKELNETQEYPVYVVNVNGKN